MTGLNVTWTGFLFLKPDNVQRLENSRRLGKNELCHGLLKTCAVIWRYQVGLFQFRWQ